MSTPCTHVRCITLLLLASLAVGCEAKPEIVRTEAHLGMEKLGIMFLRYASRNQGKTPPNEKALKDFINTIDPAERQGMELTNVDALFISPNDKKPYIIKYGIAFVGRSGGSGAGGYPGRGPGGKYSQAAASSSAPTMPLLAAESSGAKRYVLFATGEVQQLDEAEVLKLLK